jgi:Methyltransferase domain
MTPRFDFEVRSACPACGGRSETLYRCSFARPPISTFINDYYCENLTLPGVYRVERCGGCGTMFQAEVGTLPFLEKLYGEWIKSIKPEEDAAFMFDVSNARMSRDGHEIMAAGSYLRMPLGKMVTLDYGAGWAGWARVSKSLGCQSHSFDLAPDRQAMAESHGILPDYGRYHFINTEQAMEHITDPASTTEQLAAKLLPGGILKISVPSNRGASATLARLKSGQERITHDEIMPVLPLEHVNCFTRDGLRALGRQFGLVEVRPGYRHRFAFLRHVGTVRPSDPKRAAKEMIRPFWQWRNPANLYIWLQRPA